MSGRLLCIILLCLMLSVRARDLLAQKSASQTATPVDVIGVLIAGASFGVDLGLNEAFKNDGSGSTFNIARTNLSKELASINGCLVGQEFVTAKPICSIERDFMSWEYRYPQLAAHIDENEHRYAYLDPKKCWDAPSPKCIVKVAEWGKGFSGTIDTQWSLNAFGVGCRPYNRGLEGVAFTITNKALDGHGDYCMTLKSIDGQLRYTMELCGKPPKCEQTFFYNSPTALKTIAEWDGGQGVKACAQGNVMQCGEGANPDKVFGAAQTASATDCRVVVPEYEQCGGEDQPRKFMLSKYPDRQWDGVCCDPDKNLTCVRHDQHYWQCTRT